MGRDFRSKLKYFIISSTNNDIFKLNDFVISGVIGTFLIYAYRFKYGDVEVGFLWSVINFIGMHINCYGGSYFLVILIRFIRRQH